MTRSPRSLEMMMEVAVASVLRKGEPDSGGTRDDVTSRRYSSGQLQKPKKRDEPAILLIHSLPPSSTLELRNQRTKKPLRRSSFPFSSTVNTDASAVTIKQSLPPRPSEKHFDGLSHVNVIKPLPQPPSRKDERQLQAHRQSVAPPRSFLEIYLARKQKRESQPPRSATSKVLNPINYVPRAIETARSDTHDTQTLLTLPEQRRLKEQNSPTAEKSKLPRREHSNHKIAHFSADHRTHRDTASMTDLEKLAESGGQGSDHAQVPTSRYNTTYSPLTSPSSVLSPSYGLNPLDDSPHPPRRVSDGRSLRQRQSSTSLQSSNQLPRTNSEAPPPIPPQYDGEQYASEDPETGNAEEELAWGPSHPCFPHLNPHVPLSSAEYKTTRVIRIRRDWMVAGDLAPTYSNLYPEILDPLFPEHEFRYVVQHINETLLRAFDPYSTWNWFDGLLGVLTGWLWEDFRPGGIKKQLKNLEIWIEDWNHKVGARDGVKIMSLRRTGYMNLDVQIPDPQVRIIGEGDSVLPQ